MTDLALSLFKHVGFAPEISPGHHAIYVLEGEVEISSQKLRAGEGFYLNGQDQPNISVSGGAEFLQFHLRQQAIGSFEIDPLIECNVEIEQGPKIFRLDQVSFPHGSCAYRHVHYGAGIRYLKEGSLELNSDHGVELVQTGNAWFEPSHSPVRATPQNEEPACFIRAMLIPARFEGKPTIKYLNQDDIERPKLQKTHRFFDQAVAFQIMD